MPEILGTLQCTDESGQRRYFVRDAAGREHPVTAGDRLLCRGVGFEWCNVWQYGLSLFLSGPTIHQRLLTFVGADVALSPIQAVVSRQRKEVPSIPVS